MLTELNIVQQSRSKELQTGGRPVDLEIGGYEMVCPETVDALVGSK